jgi:hypothetical protein
MRPEQLPLTDQIFTHIDPTSGVNTTIAASALRRYCTQTLHPETVLIPVTAEGAMLMKMKRGIERDRIIAACKTLPSDLLPLLFCDWDYGTQLLVDGTHTYVAHFIRKWSYAKAWIVPRHIWCPRFVVEGIRQFTETELLASHSRIPTRKATP